jgi:hypothetical protein
MKWGFVEPAWGATSQVAAAEAHKLHRRGVPDRARGRPTGQAVHQPRSEPTPVNAKPDRLYELVAELKCSGVPIDGVGLQMHANVRGVSPSFHDNMRRFAALGLEVALTEVDVAIKLGRGAVTLLDESLMPKPAFGVVQRALWG